jgi:hypothetical protein
MKDKIGEKPGKLACWSWRELQRIAAKLQLPSQKCVSCRWLQLALFAEMAANRPSEWSCESGIRRQKYRFDASALSFILHNSSFILARWAVCPHDVDRAKTRFIL